MKALFVLADGREVLAARWVANMEILPNGDLRLLLDWETPELVLFAEGDKATVKIGVLEGDCKILHHKAYRFDSYSLWQCWTLVVVG